MKSLLKLCSAFAFLLFSSSTYAIMMDFSVHLTGASEVGGGDPDGYGMADLSINGDTDELYWTVTFKDILAPLTGAHIHMAPVGSNGGVVVNFGSSLPAEMTSDGMYQFSGSLMTSAASEILANPTNYYVNVHNSEFPAGAIRGQLSAPSNSVPDTLGSAWGAFSIALILILGRRLASSRRG